MFQFLTDFSGLILAFINANEDTPSGIVICLYISEMRKYHVVTGVKGNNNLGVLFEHSQCGINDLYVALTVVPATHFQYGFMNTVFPSL